MTFPRALLLSALLGSAALVKAAPVARSASCDLNLHDWGAITFEGTDLSLGEDGELVVGGAPIYFVAAACQTTYTDKYDQQSEGYIVNANNSTQCLTVSSLDQSDATLSLQDCSFDGAGYIAPSQSFAWDWDDNGTGAAANAYFNGQNTRAVNSTQPPTYTFKAQHEPDIDNKRGKLLVDYTPNLTSLPTPIQVPMQGIPVTAPTPPTALNCPSYHVGSINFNNQTSSSNQYDGPLNSAWEAQKDTSDKFIFEQCDFPNYKTTDDVVYGRIRPGSDLQDNKFQCYDLTGPDDDEGDSDVPKDHAWISGLQLNDCSYIGATPAKWNKTDNTIHYSPFDDGSQPGVMVAYTQLDYDAEYGVTQHVWDPLGIGFAYIARDNSNLTKYPPGVVTFTADS